MMPKLSMKVISQTISSSYVLSSRVSIPVEISANVLSKKNKACYFSHFSNQVRVWVLCNNKRFWLSGLYGMRFEL
jgi:hypothetical protein